MRPGSRPPVALWGHAVALLWGSSALGHLWLLWSRASDLTLWAAFTLLAATLVSGAFALVARRFPGHPALGLVLALLVFAVHHPLEEPLAEAVTAASLVVVALLAFGLGGSPSRVSRARASRSIPHWLDLHGPPRVRFQTPHLSRPPPALLSVA